MRLTQFLNSLCSMETQTEQMDQLISLSMSITDRLYELKRHPSFLACELDSYLAELESVAHRLQIYPKVDREHLQFKQMVFPWIVFQTMCRSNTPQEIETQSA